jgi:4-alpha-glucanotransferase
MTHQPPPRDFGLLIPAFCLRRDGDLGIGDTTAMRHAVAWAARRGIGFVQLLPLNEAGPDNSPYNAISSVALDPVYLDLSGVEGIPAAEGKRAVAESQERCAGGLVDYSAVRRVKMHLLRTGYERWLQRHAASEDGRQFRAFCQRESGWLAPYCAYSWAMLREGHERWEDWPQEIRSLQSLNRLLEQMGEPQRRLQVEFFAWVQWWCHRQWQHVRADAAALGVRLMGDIPIGVSRYSGDVFAAPHLFDLEWSGGSPPEPAFADDPFTQHWGQNWGIPLYRWLAHEAEGFAWWRQRVAKCCQIFDWFRIDHVLGFYRLYAFPWRPWRNGEFTHLSHEEAASRTGGRLPRFFERPDDSWENQQANRTQGDWLLRMVQSAAPQAEIVGEDLGTVPEYVRPHLAELGMPGFKIPQWEESPHFPECSLAVYATHDHPPLRTLWDQCAAQHGTELWRLAHFAGIDLHAGVPAWSPDLQWRLIGALAHCPSRHAALMITELFDMRERFNVPGAAGGENWRLRLPWPVESWGDVPALEASGTRLAEVIAASGRSRKS